MLITLNQTKIFHCKGINLIPGANKVDPKWWSEARKHPNVKSKLNAGLISEDMDLSEVEGKSSEEIEQMTKDHLTALPLNAARAIVKETVDQSLLEAWHEAESKGKNRQPLLQAIDKQFQALKATPEKRDRSQSRQISAGNEIQTVELKAKPGPQDGQDEFDAQPFGLS